MTLLDKLKTQGSTLTDVDGNTPKKYSGNSNYKKDLKTSQLDLDGKKPLAYDKSSKYQESLAKSQLDLDGRTPNKYLSNPPR